MKKIIALAIAIVMMAAMAVPAFAATEGTTTVEYTVGESYTLTVPATMNLNTTTAGNVTVADYNVLAANKVTVTATSTWKLDDAAQTEFQLDKTTFEFTANGEQAFNVSWKNEAPSVAGEYSGTITFTGAIGSAS